jgi:oligoribonuclease NrnB/cAMP/cGMP phosphodiesterase (DHH superfamily)
MIEGLREVKKIVTHLNCPDGVCSAIVLKYAYQLFGLAPEIVFVQYKTKAYEELQAEPNMLFCDMSPPLERVQEFRDQGAIILDHHIGAKDLVLSFGDKGIFANEKTEPGVSGALLAYLHVWLPLITVENTFLKNLAIVAGVRDTWQRQDSRWDQACAQVESLLLMPPDKMCDRNFHEFQLYWRDTLEPIGQILLDKKHQNVVKDASKGWAFTGSDGTKVFVVCSKLASDIAEYLGEEHDLYIAFSFDELGPDGFPKTTLSMRSRKGYSCLDFAKFLGGNGHTNAAGASVFNSGNDPYRAVKSYYETFVEAKQHG